jgi:hypothetical protein
MCLMDTKGWSLCSQHIRRRQGPLRRIARREHRGPHRVRRLHHPLDLHRCRLLRLSHHRRTQRAPGAARRARGSCAPHASRLLGGVCLCRRSLRSIARVSAARKATRPPRSCVSCSGSSTRSRATLSRAASPASRSSAKVMQPPLRPSRPVRADDGLVARENLARLAPCVLSSVPCSCRCAADCAQLHRRLLGDESGQDGTRPCRRPHAANAQPPQRPQPDGSEPLLASMLASTHGSRSWC